MKTAAEMLFEKGGSIVTVPSTTTIVEALHIMVDHSIGAVVIKDDNQVKGIWTERDLMRNTLQAGFNPQTAKIGDYMTTNLKAVSSDSTCFMLLDKFLGLRLRHLLIEKDGEYIGMLSIGDVIKANLVEKTKELEKLNEMISWDYYEDWRWKNED